MKRLTVFMSKEFIIAETLCLLQLVYKFSAIPIKTSIGSFHESLKADSLTLFSGRFICIFGDFGELFMP